MALSCTQNSSLLKYLFLITSLWGLLCMQHLSCAPELLLIKQIISHHEQTVNLLWWRWLFHYFGFPVHSVSSGTSFPWLTQWHHGEFNPGNCTGQICPISPTGTDCPRIDDIFISNIKCPSIKFHWVVIADLLSHLSTIRWEKVPDPSNPPALKLRQWRALTELCQYLSENINVLHWGPSKISLWEENETF